MLMLQTVYHMLKFMYLFQMASNYWLNASALGSMFSNSIVYNRCTQSERQPPYDTE